MANEPVLGQETIDNNGQVVKPAALPISTGRRGRIASTRQVADASQNSLHNQPINTLGLNDDQLGSQFGADGQMTANGQIDLTQLEDQMAGEQGAGEAFMRSAGKFALKTGINAVGGAIGGVYGLGSAIVNKDFSKIYDNDVAQGLDVLTSMVDEELGVYKSNEYREGNFFQKMANPLMFTDEVSDALAFTAGAIVTEYVTGGLASAAIASRAAGLFRVNALKKIAGAAKLANAADETNKAVGYAGKLEQTRSMLSSGRQIFLTGSAWEASVETRQAMNDVRKNLKAKGVDDAEIEKIVNSAEGQMFFGNLAIVNVSQMAQFPGLFKGPASWAGKNLEHKGVRTFLEKQGKEMVTKNTGTWAKAGIGTFRALKNPLMEGAWEEGLQGVLSKSTVDTYSSKMYDGDDGAVTGYKALTDAFKHQYTTKEGLNDVLMGALIGGMGRPVFNKSQDPNASIMDKVKDFGWTDSLFNEYMTAGKDAAMAADAAESMSVRFTDYLQDKLKSGDATTMAMEDYVRAVEAGSSLAGNAHDDFIFEYMKPFIKYGYGDMARTQIESMAALSPDGLIDSINEPNAAEELKSQSQEKKDKYKKDIITSLEGKIDALDKSYKRVAGLAVPKEVRDQLAYYGYKGESLRIDNSILADKINESIQGMKDLLPNDSQHADLDALGKAIIENAGAGSTNKHVLDTLKTQLATGAIDQKLFDKISKTMETDVEAEGNGLSQAEAALVEIAKFNDPIGAKDLQEELEAARSNTNLINSYRELVNKYLSNQKQYNKMLSEDERASILESVQAVEDNPTGFTSLAQFKTYRKQVEDRIANNSEMNVDDANDIKRRLDVIEAAIEKADKEAKQRAEEAKKYEKSEVTESNDKEDEDGSVDTGHDTSNFVDMDDTGSQVDASAATHSPDTITTFDTFIRDMLKKGVIMTANNSTSKIKFFHGGLTDNNNTDFAGFPSVDELSKMSEADFIKLMTNSKADGLHIGVDITVNSAKAGEFKYSTYMYTATTNKDGNATSDAKSIKQAAKYLHQALKEAHKNGVTNLAEINIDYDHVKLTRGLFKHKKHADGSVIYEDIPVLDLFTNATGSFADTNDILDQLVYTDSNGQIKGFKTRTSVKGYAATMLNNKGKKIKGQIFIKGKDEFGRPTLYKLNARQLSSSPELLSVVEKFIVNMMTKSLTEVNSKENVAELAGALPKGFPISDTATAFQILDMIVHNGSKTAGTAGDLRFVAGEKVIILAGTAYKYDENNSDSSGMMFTNVATGAPMSLNSIMSAIGQLRQNIRIKKMSEDEAYASYMLANAIQSDAAGSLEIEDGEVDLSPMLERPKLFIGKSKVNTKELFKEPDLEKDGLEKVIRTHFDTLLSALNSTTKGKDKDLTMAQALAKPNGSIILDNLPEFNQSVQLDGIDLPNNLSVHIVGYDKKTGVAKIKLNLTRKNRSAGKDFTQAEIKFHADLKESLPFDKMRKTFEIPIGKITGITTLVVTSSAVDVKQGIPIGQHAFKMADESMKKSNLEAFKDQESELIAKLLTRVSDLEGDEKTLLDNYIGTLISKAGDKTSAKVGPMIFNSLGYKGNKVNSLSTRWYNVVYPMAQVIKGYDTWSAKHEYGSEGYKKYHVAEQTRLAKYELIREALAKDIADEVQMDGLSEESKLKVINAMLDVAARIKAFRKGGNFNKGSSKTKATSAGYLGETKGKTKPAPKGTNGRTKVAEDPGDTEIIVKDKEGPAVVGNGPATKLPGMGATSDTETIDKLIGNLEAVAANNTDPKVEVNTSAYDSIKSLLGLVFKEGITISTMGNMGKHMLLSITVNSPTGDVLIDFKGVRPDKVFASPNFDKAMTKTKLKRRDNINALDC